jgi:hypothetical protein
VIERVRQRQKWRFFGALSRAAPVLTSAWWVLLVLGGFLPALLAIATGTVVGAVDRGAPLAGPLVFVGGVFVTLQILPLDEPTAALDAETEHALFERYAASAHREVANGRITILVSHRFSTVRMADLIVVLDSARVVEVGTHEELMARRGHYAELYDIQATAYR